MRNNLGYNTRLLGGYEIFHAAFLRGPVSQSVRRVCVCAGPATACLPLHNAINNVPHVIRPPRVARVGRVMALAARSWESLPGLSRATEPPQPGAAARKPAPIPTSCIFLVLFYWLLTSI